MTQNIVVAYDGSDPSERALDWAILEAQKRQEPLKIVLSTGRQTGLDQSIYGAFADALHGKVSSGIALLPVNVIVPACDQEHSFHQ